MAGLGEILQNARQMRGVSLEEAERATHISRRYLQALEAEDFSVFVAPVFARGFLRNYSQYLGLDPGEMLLLWPQAGEAAAGADAEPETSRAEFERRARPLRERGARRRNPVTHGSEPPSPLTRPTLTPAPPTIGTRVLVAIAGLVVVLAVVAIVAGKAAGRPRGSSLLAGGAAASSSPSAGQAAGAGQPRPSPSPPPRQAGAMPNFVGKDAQAAIQQLQQAGVTPLVISVTSANRSDRPGAVIRQTPSTGTSLNTNSTVTLVVNQAPVAAPAPGSLPASTTPQALRPATPIPTRAATPAAR